MKILGFDTNWFGATKIPNIKDIANVEVPADAKIYDGITPTSTIPYEITLYRVSQDIKTWRDNVQFCENVYYSQRREIYRTYKDTVLDLHLSSLMSTRKFHLTNAEFEVVDKNGIVNEEKTKLIKGKKWFYDFIDLSLDSVFYGHSLIQFGNLLNDEFERVRLVPREYVKPEKYIVVNNPSNYTGHSFLESPYKEWCIGVGEERDLGLLMKLTPYVIWKTGAFQSWAEFNSTYGVPMRVAKTDKNDLESRNRLYRMLTAMSKSMVAVLGTNDTLEFVDATKGHNSDLYTKMVEMTNQEMSKLVLGQTGTTDEKSFVGSANVHERIMDSYNKKDEMFMQNIFTHKLIPFLNGHGFGLEGYDIIRKADEDLDLVSKSKIDLEMMKYYDLNVEYLEKVYGCEIDGIKATPTKPEGVKNIENKFEDIHMHNGCCVDNKTVYDPEIPHHFGCVCKIIDGQYEFGASKSGPCDYCVSSREAWNIKHSTTL